MRRHRRSNRGFSLVELVASLVVISVVAAVLAPVLNSAADTIVTTRDLRRASDDAGFAMATAIRLLREVPPGEGVNLGLASADDTSIVFSDGRGLRLNADTLELVTPAGAAPVARDVSSFEIRYLGPDGHAPAAPADAQRLHITMTVRGMTLSGVAFPRVNSGQSGSGGGP